MKDENLKNIQSKYNELIQLRESIQKRIDKKKELEQDPKVKEYLTLLEELENCDQKMISLSNEDILDKAIRSEKITESNNIFVCMGTYKCSCEKDVVHGSSDYRVSKDDPNADYRVYCDIEKGFDSSIEVSISKCGEFEKNNIVFYPRSVISSKYYNEIRNLFFQTAVMEGQERAVDKVKQKTN